MSERDPIEEAQAREDRRLYWNQAYAKYWQERVSESNRLEGVEHSSKMVKGDPLTGTDKSLAEVLVHLDLKKGDRFLDIGCGFGRALHMAFQKTPFVTGIDISEPMIECTKEGLSRIFKDVPGTIDLFVSEAESTPFAAESFDRVLCFAVFDALHQDEALIEMNRILRIGGLVALTGKADAYAPDDTEAYVAETNARSKGHPNSFTDIPLLLRSLPSFGFELVRAAYFERRGDLAKGLYRSEQPINFYEYSFVLRKTGQSRWKPNECKIGNTFSKTWHSLNKNAATTGGTMTSQQQQETLNYFRDKADNWRQKAKGEFAEMVNIIEQRNNYVLHVAKNRSELRKTLDIGCGTGELTCSLAELGAESSGVDFSPEMIALCQKKARDEGTKRAKFVCKSIFEFDFADGPYDLIAANGFIEYISTGQLKEFLGLVAKNLNRGGSFVFGTRNRLFNAFSLNEFTQYEMELGCLPQLMKEAMILASEKDMGQCLKKLAAQSSSLPSFQSHPKTGVDVSTRYQYTPSELVHLLSDFGFKTVDLCAAHCHGMVPALKAEQPNVHVAIANLLQSYVIGRPQLIPFASTFMVHGRIE